MNKIQTFEKLSAEGWTLIPLEGKKPIESGWQKWCSEKRQYKPADFDNGRNAGLPQGPANGTIALDVDDLEGFNKWLNAKKFKLPQTRVHMTGRGLPHYFYQYPPNGKRYGNAVIKNGAGHVADIRGIGGQVVAPGSIHPETGKPYTVRNDGPVAPAPPWLLSLCIQDEPRQDPNTDKEPRNTRQEGLNIPFAIKKLIREGASKGDRSEAIMSVLNALVRAGATDSQIIGIFEAHEKGIAAKYFEKANTREKWLLSQVAKVRATCKPRSKSGRTPRFLNVEAMVKEFGKEIVYLWRNDLFPRANPVIVGGREGGGKSSNVAQFSKEIVESNPNYWVLWVACEGFAGDHTDKWYKLRVPSRVIMLSDNKGLFKLRLDNYRDREFLDESLQALKDETGGEVAAVVIDSIRGMQSMGENDPKLSAVMSEINSIVCDRHKACCVYIAHHKKGRTEKRSDLLSGTTGIPSSVRAVYSIEKLSECVCKIVPDKNNALGHAAKTYRSVLIEDDSGFFDIAITDEVDQMEPNKVGKAQNFLVDLFKTRKRIRATDIYTSAANEGLSGSTLRKAKVILGIESTRDESGGPFFWVWPY